MLEIGISLFILVLVIVVPIWYILSKCPIVEMRDCSNCRHQKTMHTNECKESPRHYCEKWDWNGER